MFIKVSKDHSVNVNNITEARLLEIVPSNLIATTKDEEFDIKDHKDTAVLHNKDVLYCYKFYDGTSTHEYPSLNINDINYFKLLVIELTNGFRYTHLIQLNSLYDWEKRTLEQLSLFN